MSGEWTLPLVQDQLDDLASGQDFTLTKDEYVRLFGLDDVAARRIRRFADSHCCHTFFDGRQLIFRKNGFSRSSA
jgi:hypothetical protein